jgi:drug/metabolite transporter (DMT)-like permease
LSYVPIDLRGASLAILVSLFWGVNPVFIKLGLLDAPPLRLAGLRLLVGFVVLALWGWTTGRLAGFRISPAERLPLLMLGLMMAVQIGSMNIATGLTSAAHAAIFLNLYAVHTVVFAHFLIPGDRLTARKLAGVVVGYAGIVLLFARQSAGTASVPGDVLVFVSGLILAERTIYLARAVQHLDPVKLLLSQAAIGTVVFFLVSFFAEAMPVRWTPRLAGVLGFQGAVLAGFNFVVNLWLLKRYRPSALTPFFLTQPIFGVVAAALVTGDRLTPDLLLASLAVAAGIGLSAR